MRNKLVETIIVISLLPVFPVIATRFLPWEKWVPKWIPNKVIGPYLLYCAFAAWYFTMPIWTVTLVAALGIGVSVAAIAESRDTSSK